MLSALQARLVYTAVSLTAHRIHSMYRGFYILASDEPIPIVVVKRISAFVYFFFFFASVSSMTVLCLDLVIINEELFC